MTNFPMYLSEYPNMNTTFPFHLSINNIHTSFPSHRHDYLEFSLVIEGEGFEIINGKKHRMQPGTFTFILPYQIHEIISAKNTSLILFNCVFDLRVLHDLDLQSLLSDTDQLSIEPYIALGVEDFIHIKKMLHDMLIEYNDNKPYKHILLKAKLAEVIVLFERIRKRNYSVTLKNSNSTKKKVIWDVVHYIHLQYHEDITLSSLSKKFHVSIPYLSELFKEQLGQNFVHFLHEVRIRHASSLLTSTTVPVTDIALEVGYRSFQTFSRVFREQKNLTPTAYRKSQASLRQELNVHKNENAPLA